MRRRLAAVVLVVAGFGVVPAMAQAGGVGQNAGFETASLARWEHSEVTCAVSSSAPRSIAVRGDRLPSGFAQWGIFSSAQSLGQEFGGVFLPEPFQDNAAVFFQDSPALGTIRRSFRIPRNAKRIQFRIWWLNQASTLVSAPANRGIPAGAWERPSGFKCPSSGGSTNGAQYISADLLKPNAPNGSLAKKHRLLRIWASAVGRTSAGSNGWVNLSASVKRLRGKKVKFRLGVIAIRGFLTVGLDELRITG